MDRSGRGLTASVAARTDRIPASTHTQHTRSRAINVPLTGVACGISRLLIPEGVGPCQWVICGSGGMLGVRNWPFLFPVAAVSVVSGLAGQGPGGARPRSGAAGVLGAAGLLAR